MVATKHNNLRAVALPTEHGGWGFLLEPILLGLLVAPSWWGLLLGIAITILFLAHQPFKIVAKDYLKRRRVNRTRWAERFAFLYGATSIVLLSVIIRNNDIESLYPIGAASLLALVQLIYDSRSDSRALIPEISGALALAGTASSIALLASWEPLPALMLWVVLAVRAVTAILYVRARLRKVYDKPHGAALVYIMHTSALLLFTVIAATGEIPVLSIIAMGILAVRAYLGLTSTQKVAPKVVGMTEMIYGMVYTVVMAIGYWMALL